MSFYSVAAEKYVAAKRSTTIQMSLMLRHLGVRDAESVLRLPAQDQERLNVLKMGLHFLSFSQPIFWAGETATLVRDTSATMDLQTLRLDPSLLTIPNAFCWFDQPWGLTEVTESRSGQRIGLDICALSWFWAQSGHGISFISEAGEEQDALWIDLWSQDPRDGRLIPTEFMYWQVGPHPPVDHPAVRFTLAANAFLRQRLLRREEKQVERHARKRLGTECPETMSVVYLRSIDRSSPRGGDTSSVDWASRWFVRGHWRNQWYPALKTHRPKFIAPYLKGPEGKPVKAPAAQVVAAVR